MKRIKLYIPGPPVAQKRPRFVRRGAGVGTYDPSAAAKADLVRCVEAQVRPAIMHGPLAVGLAFYLPRPKSHRTAAGKLKTKAPSRHVSRPDVDNLAKFVLDALNGVLWLDDALIVGLLIEKHYAEGDSPGGTHITIDSLT